MNKVLVLMGMAWWFQRYAPHEDQLREAQDDAKEGKRLQNQLDDMYATDSHMPLAFYKDVLQRDVFLTAEEKLWLQNVTSPL